ncbi:MAG: hypothetical protein CMP23_13715 [Rickettsiales bacterium]|nr:hypothetical protein [Rickettsiales bacterium]|tara:strand:- start:2531 stop:3796 length:1266 start_codon:yes stop_codon:yes gene_type:complete
MRRLGWSLIATLLVFSVSGLGVVGPVCAADNGIPVGEIVFKPSLRAEAVYDSNVRRAQLSPEADFGLTVRPAIGLVYPGDNFRWTLDAYYRFFTYFNAGNNPDIDHSDLRVFTEFGVATRIQANRQGKVGLDFSPSLSNNPSASGFAGSVSYVGDSREQRLSVGVPVKVHFRPTSAFQLFVQGGWDWARPYFPAEAFDPNPTILGNRHKIGGGGGLDWKFFPRSHVLFSGEVGRVLWGDFDEGTVNHSSQLPATEWKLWLGLQGDISRKLAFRGVFGYGNIDFGEGNDSFDVGSADGILGQIELSMRPTTTQRLAVGFKRDFNYRYFTNRLLETQGYFKYQGLFSDRLQVAADFSYIYRDMAGWLTRTEHQWSAGVEVDVLLARWFRVVAGYRFSAIDPSSTNEGEYIDNRINLGITLGFP